MKIVLKILVLIVLAYYAEHVFPWWSIAAASLLVFFAVPSKMFTSFLSGFFALGVLWFWLSWRTHMQTEGVLSEKISEALQLPNPIYLVLLAGLVGGFVGGVSALVGSRMRGLFVKRRSRSLF